MAAKDLLRVCENGLKFLNSMTAGIGLESEKQNKQAFKKMLRQVITKAKKGKPWNMKSLK